WTIVPRSAGSGDSQDRRAAGGEGARLRSGVKGSAARTQQRIGSSGLSRAGSLRGSNVPVLPVGKRRTRAAAPQGYRVQRTARSRRRSFSEGAASPGDAGLSAADDFLHRRSGGTGVSRAIASSLRSIARPDAGDDVARRIYAARTARREASQTVSAQCGGYVR